MWFNQWFVLGMVAKTVDNLTKDCINMKVWYQTSGLNCWKHINIHFITRLYKDTGCDETHRVTFPSSEHYETPFHSTGTCEKSIVVGGNGGKCSFIVFGLLVLNS